MAARVVFTAGFSRRYTDGVREFTVEAKNLRGVIKAMDRLYPGLGHHLEEETTVAIDGAIHETAYFPADPSGLRNLLHPQARRGVSDVIRMIRFALPKGGVHLFARAPQISASLYASTRRRFAALPRWADEQLPVAAIRFDLKTGGRSRGRKRCAGPIIHQPVNTSAGNRQRQWKCTLGAGAPLASQADTVIRKLP
jgi:molybdopterin synthase sulfur carrier subunit